MPVLRGHFAAVDGFPTEGTVTAWSPRLRPSSDFAVTGEKRVAPLTDGKFEIDLVPGEVQLNIQGNSQFHPLELTIPTQDEPVELLDLLEGDFEYAPEVVQAAQQAARDAREYLRQSREIAETFGSVEHVGELEASARASAATADGHRRSAATSAGEAGAQAVRSEAEADRSAGQARASADSAGDADASAKAAAESEDEAGKSQVAAAGHEEAARGYSVTAGEHAGAADGHRKAAATSEANAKTSEANASGSESRARDAAASADQTVRDAVTEVTAVTDGHRQAAETAAGEARSSATEGRGYRDQAREYMDQAEKIAIGDLPDATGETRGLVTLAGDLAGTGAAPTVPALALAAPGASVQVVPPAPGWANAVADAATTPTGWDFDGEWLTPPRWVGLVHVTVEWCGGSSVVLRGRRPDGTAVTLATVPAGTPETHRQVATVVDLDAHPSLAIGAEWTAEDVEAVCTASLVVQVLPAHEHTRADLPWWDEVMSQYVRGDDARLSDPRSPTEHVHPTGQVTGLDDALAERPTRAEVQARPAMWIWDGLSEWVAPDGAVATDTVLNLDTGELHTIEEVTGDE